MQTTKVDCLVLGAGPGGYAAAFYAADMGRQVTLVEQVSLGGVCLNAGCIPSKSLLHISHLIEEAREAKSKGLSFSEPKIDVDQLRSWKNKTITELQSGIKQLAKARKIQHIEGRAFFEDDQTVRVETDQGQQVITFETCILAVGSKPNLPAAFDLGNKRIMTSKQALEIESIPKSLLVIGGGYIGMELGTVYQALGSKVVLIEAQDTILLGADRDLARPVINHAKARFSEIRTKTKVQSLATKGKQIRVEMESEGGEKQVESYDKVLVSIGRVPNTHDLGLQNTSIELDEKGFVKVNASQQTSQKNIFAIGDIVGGAMLAHKATKEARIAVDASLGKQSSARDIIIPAVVFTSPELAWCGLTEEEAKQKNIPVTISKFPWSASGRARTLGSTEGLTKLVLEPETDRVLGVGIVGHNAGELIAEGVLAVEMAATAKDLAETIHPHPTLSETLMECAEAHFGLATHTISRKA